MDIYHQRRANCIGQSIFVNWLRYHFREANYIEEAFPIKAIYLNNPVNKHALNLALIEDRFLPGDRKQHCSEVLINECLDNIKVATTSKRISCDVVIKCDEEIFYWEFHEKQHRELTDNRHKKIYNAEDKKAIDVPRCLQRLIRDVWRVQTLGNYTIVWQDWFITNCFEFSPSLQTGFHEFSLPNKFSFSNFLKS
jgi:hypothetical protein